jgi:hypothetical protein
VRDHWISLLRDKHSRVKPNIARQNKNVHEPACHRQAHVMNCGLGERGVAI